ncbi:sensor histidine kinase [Kitasatospora sp. RB6PN24]|uniref:sensor histidine kinase n=1 Tax=Kitasatospora humi TaxID=2893891 RepID=UPI001E3373C0|nr:sensor histidine kinase [Kitasatospora humi]MCC9308411.1 sensor histidine kinase [Kitasatospora humi]
MQRPSGLLALPRRLQTLLRRLSPDALAALNWCAVPPFALLLYVTMPQPLHPVGPLLDPLRPGPLRVLVLAVVMALPIGWASRRAPQVLGVVLAEVLVLRVCGQKLWPLFLAAVVLVFYIAVNRSRRTAGYALAATVAVGIADSVRVQSSGAAVRSLTGPSSLHLVVTAAAWILGSWIRLRQTHAEALRTQAAHQAVQDERLRIARELHDMVAHSIGVIAIQAGAGSRVFDTQPAVARAALGAIESTGRETLAGLRRMLVALREADSDHAESAPAPGLADVERLAATAAGAGVEVEVRWGGTRRGLPPEIDLSAYRIIQESVTNVVRHAGVARCRVLVDYREEELSIEVTDDGRGGAPTSAGSGYGLVGMRERVGLLHGQFTAGPRPEGGYRVAARLPV